MPIILYQTETGEPQTFFHAIDARECLASGVYVQDDPRVKAKADAEAKIKEEAAARAKADMEAKAKMETEAKAKVREEAIPKKRIMPKRIEK